MVTFSRSELMMFFGVPGTGKTQGALTIAVANPQATFHYLEADRRLDSAFEWFGDWDAANLIRWPAFEFEEFMDSSKQIIEILKGSPQPQNEWVIVDTIGHCYREIQNWYSYETYKVMADALKDQRMNGNKTGWQNAYSFDGFSGSEWAIIKRKFYNEFLWPLIRFHRNNAIIIAHARANTDHFHPQAPSEFAERFQKLGQYPDVHKDVIRYLDTVLYFSNVESFTFRTMKETGRRNWMNDPAPFSDFWVDYSTLVKV